MSIWTNSALALACAGLAACAGMEMGTQPRSVVVQGGDIEVTAPAGYCANPQASTDGAGSAVVLMGRCSATSSATPALITASVGATGSGSALDAGPVALTSFFTSDQGREMLASTGTAEDAVVTSSETEDAAVLLRIKDANIGEYWRAILALKGRLVMLSATGAESVVLPPDQGRALLSKSMAVLRSANPDKTAPAAGLTGLFASSKTPAAPTVLVMAPPEGSLRPKPRVPSSK